MAKPIPLPVWDRQRGTLLAEWMDDHQPHYESEPQRSFTQWVKSQPIYDRLYALYENSRLSRREIEPFIRKYHIDMAEFEPVRYRSYAEFFDRRFRSGVRKFPSSPEEMGAFAEARYFGWQNVEPGQKFPVKGHSPNRFSAVLTGRASLPAGLCYSCVSLPLTTTTCTIPMMERPGTISAWAAASGP